ncbi:hypothetical protein ACPFP2_13230 [Micromonospora citrea]|uniref:hypothetical protein n=1 Tax=Micromonospora citrea TaxID=47855 RepID=UPI003C5BC178
MRLPSGGTTRRTADVMIGEVGPDEVVRRGAQVRGFGPWLAVLAVVVLLSALRLRALATLVSLTWLAWCVWTWIRPDRRRNGPR